MNNVTILPKIKEELLIAFDIANEIDCVELAFWHHGYKIPVDSLEWLNEAIKWDKVTHITIRKIDKSKLFDALWPEAPPSGVTFDARGTAGYRVILNKIVMARAILDILRLDKRAYERAATTVFL